jgi:DNA repair exonuclease SbcCD nuclease subunit
VDPLAMNHAVEVLQKLRAAKIPCVVIEGNHDQHAKDASHSWLRSLAAWRLMILLEPTVEDGQLGYEQWSDEKTRGSFVDIGRARIFGSHWFGASAGWAIPMLTKLIKANRRKDAFHILLLHTDVEGHQSHPLPALTLAGLKELKSAADYVALGHTHKNFEIDNWAFNPGSLEITNISDYREKRGAYLVNVTDKYEIAARHVEDYIQRPFLRMSFDVSGIADTLEIASGILEKARREITPHQNDAEAQKPIVEITLLGHLGFPNSLLELNKIRDQVLRYANALSVRVRNATVPIEYAAGFGADEDIDREALEHRVVEDLIMRDNRYKLRAEKMAQAVIGAKRLALGDEPPEKIAEFISLQLKGKK